MTNPVKREACRTCGGPLDLPGTDMCTACCELDQHIRRNPDAAYAILQSLAPSSPRMTPALQAIRAGLAGHPLPWRSDGATVLDARGVAVPLHGDAVVATLVDLVNILPTLQGK